MAKKLEVDETVYVPCSRVADLRSTGVALYRTKVVEVEPSRVRIRLRNGSPSDWIGSAIVHRDVGILIFNIGDFETEHSLLDPLAISVKQFCRLLVPDDQIHSIRFRSLVELGIFWRKNQAAYTHVIWIGHGKESALKFGVDGWVDANRLAQELDVEGANSKTFISLCCKTGYKNFGSALSKTRICGTFLGPFQSVEGAVASQFCQTFLAGHLLDGKTIGVAFRHARNSVPGSTSFRRWISGDLKADPRE